MPAANTGFASGGVTWKLGVLCFYSSSMQVDSFVFHNPPERKARERCTQAKKMTKKIFTILILIGFVGISFGQINVSGGIYSDSTLTKPISKVKLILKTDSGKETYRTDKNGMFNILTDKRIKEFSLEIKKKGYITVVVNGISQDTDFDVIFRKALSIHDVGYEGTSEIIMRN